MRVILLENAENVWERNHVGALRTQKERLKDFTFYTVAS